MVCMHGLEPDAFSLIGGDAINTVFALHIYRFYCYVRINISIKEKKRSASDVCRHHISEFRRRGVGERWI